MYPLEFLTMQLNIGMGLLSNQLYGNMKSYHKHESKGYVLNIDSDSQGAINHSLTT